MTDPRQALDDLALALEDTDSDPGPLAKVTMALYLHFVDAARTASEEHEQAASTARAALGEALERLGNPPRIETQFATTIWTPPKRRLVIRDEPGLKGLLGERPDLAKLLAPFVVSRSYGARFTVRPRGAGDGRDANIATGETA